MLVTAAVALAMVCTVVTSAPAQAASAHVTEAMPNFVGLSPAQVHQVMFADQLYYSTRGLGANSTRWVRVIGELPAAGTTIDHFSTVTLYVTTAPLVTRAVESSIVVRHVIKHRGPTRPKVKSHVVTKHPHPKRPSRPSKSHVATKTTKGPHHTPTRKRVKRDVVVRAKVGVATWYDYVPGRCATWYLPFGTVVTITDLRSGRVITCRVTDREASRGNRAVDLSETQFAELAPLSVGVVPVRVTW